MRESIGKAALALGSETEDQCSAGKTIETHSPRTVSSPASSRRAYAVGVFASIILIIAHSALPASGQTPDPQPPGPAPDPARPRLNPFPVEQNWSFLADTSKRTDLFDPVKYIPFDDNPQMYLSLGVNQPTTGYRLLEAKP